MRFFHWTLLLFYLRDSTTRANTQNEPIALNFLEFSQTFRSVMCCAVIFFDFAIQGFDFAEYDIGAKKAMSLIILSFFSMHMSKDVYR